MNLLSDEIRRDPYPTYSLIRATAPVMREPQSGLWMVFDYENVKRVLTDSDTFSSSPSVANQRHPAWMIFTDPPRHTKLRALIMRAFTPKMIADLEPRIAELARALLDHVADRGEMDLAADFAIPLPIQVIAEMIGIPLADWPQFRRWSDSILKLSFTMFDAEETAAAAAEYRVTTAEMAAYLPCLIEARRAHPANDLLTRLVEAEVDGDRMSYDEILAFVQLLLVAGNETTTNLIDNAMLCFLEHPDQFDRVRAAPALLPQAIEEVLRYRSPLQWMYRATRKEVELNGQKIPANKMLLAVMGAANRDPKIFPDPDRFDITRDPNPHVAFGHGIHFCLGAPLSRVESRIALTELFRRAQNIRAASDAPWQPRRILNVLGPVSLPLRFDPVTAGQGAVG